jgi:RNA polymerase sigma-70 factor (ECF subfamily)
MSGHGRNSLCGEVVTTPKPTAAEVYEELAPAVLGYFRGQGVRDPEDLTGDVFVSMTSGLAKFKGDAAALRRWVFTIAHNRLVDEFRKGTRRQETIVADVPESSRHDTLPLDAELLTALGSLTPDQREVVVLRFVADMPLEDVARIVGKRQGAVKMLQARALVELRRALEVKPERDA